MKVEYGMATHAGLEDTIAAVIKGTKDIQPLWASCQLHSLIKPFHSTSVLEVNRVLQRLASQRKIVMVRRGLYRA